MTELKPLLLKWQSTMQEMDAQLDALLQVVGCVPESPLCSAVHATMGMTIAAMNAAYPGLDAYLESWWLENGLGERPMEIGFVGEPMRTLATIEEVADFYLEDISGR